MDGSTFDMEQYEKTYKTAMCRAFVHKGFCRYGDRCSFAHDEKELRSPQHYKTRPCQFFFRDGYCPYGTRCYFVHKEAELKPTKKKATMNPNSHFRNRGTRLPVFEGLVPSNGDADAMAVVSKSLDANVEEVSSSSASSSASSSPVSSSSLPEQPALTEEASSERQRQQQQQQQQRNAQRNAQPQSPSGNSRRSGAARGRRG